MPELASVDRVEVLVIIDNVTDSLSTSPNTAVSEWTGLSAAGRLPVLSVRCTCCAHHGLSLQITAHTGSATRTVLFGTGPEAANVPPAGGAATSETGPSTRFSSAPQPRQNL